MFVTETLSGKMDVSSTCFDAIAVMLFLYMLCWITESSRQNGGNEVKESRRLERVLVSGELT